MNRGDQVAVLRAMGQGRKMTDQECAAWLDLNHIKAATTEESEAHQKQAVARAAAKVDADTALLLRYVSRAYVLQKASVKHGPKRTGASILRRETAIARTYFTALEHAQVALTANSRARRDVKRLAEEAAGKKHHLRPRSVRRIVSRFRPVFK